MFIKLHFFVISHLKQAKAKKWKPKSQNIQQERQKNEVGKQKKSKKHRRKMLTSLSVANKWKSFRCARLMMAVLTTHHSFFAYSVIVLIHFVQFAYVHQCTRRLAHSHDNDNECCIKSNLYTPSFIRCDLFVFSHRAI